MKLFSVIVSMAVVLGMVSTSHAIVIVNIYESGGNVILEGSGSVNLSGFGAPLSGFGPSGYGYLTPDEGRLYSFPGTEMDVYTGISRFVFFGSGGISPAADIITGNNFGIDRLFPGRLWLDKGYISESPIEFSSTYLGQTLDSLGLTIGTYNWTLPSDTVTMNIVGGTAPVPEPATMLLLGSGIAAISGIRRRRSYN